MDSESLHTWNKIAELYEAHFMHLSIYNNSYDLFCDAVQNPNANILEIGCGPGNISHYCLNRKPNYNWHGIDVAEKMVQLANKNNPLAHFEVNDVASIAHLKQTFDAIISGFCIPYLSETELEKMIQNAKYLLPINGVFYLSFVEGNPKDSTFLSGSTGDRTFFYFHELSNIKKQLIQNHFNLKHTLHVDFVRQNGNVEIHTILIANKDY